MANMIYKGWIPTASERLSYSFIGESTHSGPTTSRNVADQCSRLIISCQHRPDLLDSAIPFLKPLLARLFSGIISDFWFICIAKCDNEDVHAPLKGTLCLIENTKTWKRSIRPAIQEIFKKLDDFSTLKNNNSDVPLGTYLEENGIDEQIKNLEGHLERQSLYSAQFSLERGGVVTMSPSPCTANEESSADTESCCKDNHENNQDEVYAQLFYFLKDIAHIHQHHRPTTDTLSKLYPKLSGESDLAWINKTLKTLYSKVLEYKRNRHGDSYSSTLGLLAYIDAFVKIAKEVLDDKEHKNLVLRNHDTLKASIYASQLDHQADASRRAKYFDSMKSLFFSTVAVLISVAGLANLIRDDITINIPDGFNPIEFFANAVINYPFELLLAVLAIVIILPFVRVVRIVRVVSFGYRFSFRWVRDIAIIFIVIAKSRLSAAILSILLAVLVLELSIYFYLKAPEIADKLTSLLVVIVSF